MALSHGRQPMEQKLEDSAASKRRQQYPMVLIAVATSLLLNLGHPIPWADAHG